MGLKARMTQEELELVDDFAAMALIATIQVYSHLDMDDIAEKTYDLAESMMFRRREILEIYDITD